MISDAQWALSRTTPSSTNGKMAKIDVSPSEWDTGSRTCLYTASLPLQTAVYERPVPGFLMLNRGQARLLV